MHYQRSRRNEFTMASTVSRSLPLASNLTAFCVAISIYATESTSYASTSALRSTLYPFPVTVEYLTPNLLREYEHAPSGHAPTLDDTLESTTRYPSISNPFAIVPRGSNIASPNHPFSTVSNVLPSGSSALNTYSLSPFRWSTNSTPPRTRSSWSQSDGNSNDTERVRSLEPDGAWRVSSRRDIVPSCARRRKGGGGGGGGGGRGAGGGGRFGGGRCRRRGAGRR